MDAEQERAFGAFPGRVDFANASPCGIHRHAQKTKDETKDEDENDER